MVETLPRWFILNVDLKLKLDFDCEHQQVQCLITMYCTCLTSNKDRVGGSSYCTQFKNTFCLCRFWCEMYTCCYTEDMLVCVCVHFFQVYSGLIIRCNVLMSFNSGENDMLNEINVISR